MELPYLDIAIMMELSNDDAEILFRSKEMIGSSDDQINQLTGELRSSPFPVESFWKNAWVLSEIISKKSPDTRYYENQMTVLGDLGELFLVALVNRFPNKFSIKPGTFKLAEIDQKGYDGVGEHHQDGGAVWVQMKFHNPYEPFGREYISQLDSFVQQTSFDDLPRLSKHRFLVTTARGLHQDLGGIGYERQMQIRVRQDLDNIIGGSDTDFWVEFKQACLDTIAKRGIIPLNNTQIDLRQDQVDDIAKIKINIANGDDTTMIAPPGDGKSTIACEVSKLILGGQGD